jgi:hypothetical protein
MARYFFDLHNDLDVEDPEGRDLPDLEAVKAHLLHEVREMVKASIDETGRIDLRHHIDVKNESGAVVLVMHFKDAVTVQRGPEMINRAKGAA